MARQWWPVLLWAGFILVLTSIPGAQLPQFRSPGIDKAVHLGMYGVLGWITCRTMASRGALAPGGAITITAIAVFAALDEWHQRFIPGRSMDAADWVIDVAGALAGIALVAIARRRAVPS